MPYLTASDIDANMNGLADPNVGGAKIALPNPTAYPLADGSGYGGTTYHMIKFGLATGALHPQVLLVAGQHAREWAQPDALISFLQKLRWAYRNGTSFVVPAYTDPNGNTSGPFSAPKATVKRFIKELTIFAVPLANPDGRKHSQAKKSKRRAMWRKNRAPPSTGSSAIGVDINRNYDIAWDFEVYYAKDVTDLDPLDPRAVASSKYPETDEFIGAQALGAASQPEVKNIAWIFDQNHITWCVDLHSYSNFVAYAWGIETNGADAAMRYSDPTYDRKTDGTGGRDGRLGNAHREYFPPDQLRRHSVAAEAIRDAICKATGSSYTHGGTCDLMYPATGTLTDYAFSRQFKFPGSPPIRAFVIEFGSTDDNFQPENNPLKPKYEHGYPRIEREIHTALLKILEAALP